jgi:hypothetical protein
MAEPSTNCVVCMGTGLAPVAFRKYVACQCTKPPAPIFSSVVLSASEKLRAKFGL